MLLPADPLLMMTGARPNINDRLEYQSTIYHLATW
jgi:hypothetical protein